LGGLKGQMGTSGNIIGPRTKKEKEDYKQYLKARKNVREYFTAHRCPSCLVSTETPRKTISGRMICPNCFMRKSQLVDVIPYKTYRVKPSLPKKKIKKLRAKKPKK